MNVTVKHIDHNKYQIELILRFLTELLCPLLGVLGCKTVLPRLVEPLVHCIKPPEGDETGFSIPELHKLPSVGGNEMLENGFTLK